MTIAFRVFALCVLLSLTGMNPALAQQEKLGFTVKRVKFDHSKNGVVYETEVKGQARTITYTLIDGGRVGITVAGRRGRTLVRLTVSDSEVTGSAAGARFSGTRGEPLKLDPKTDQRALWLLKQDLPVHPSLGLKPLAADVEAQGHDVKPMNAIASGVSKIIDLIPPIWDWWPGGEQCEKPGQQVTCYEEQTDGTSYVRTSAVVHTCECGTPICAHATITVEVPVAEVDATTGEVRLDFTEIVLTKCMCSCLEFDIATR